MGMLFRVLMMDHDCFIHWYLSYHVSEPSVKAACSSGEPEEFMLRRPVTGSGLNHGSCYLY